MTTQNAKFSIRGFLRERKALLVHFSTPMRRDRSLLFPDDLRNAMSLIGVPLSFSTILSKDVGPYQRGTAPERANAGGSVGLVVDILNDGAVVTVGPSDDGTDYDPTSNTWVSGGICPTAEACARSIDERQTSNEWFVKDYRQIGIFVFFPIFVWQAFKVGQIVDYGEFRIEFELVLSHFPDQRIFSVDEGKFSEYDRQTNRWLPVEYDAIIPLH